MNTTQIFMRISLALLLLLGGSQFGWAEKVTKEISKNFNVGKSDRLEVDNRYGSIHITHWDKKEVAIRILIEIQARNEKKMQQQLERIRIDMKKEGNLVVATTSLESFSGNNDIEKLTIDYHIQMPAELACGLSQKYGNIYMPERNPGTCSLESKYGNITGGDFSGPLSIVVKYGNLNISGVHEATLDLGYCGKAVVDKADRLSIESKYSSLELGEIKQMTADGKYDNYSIEMLSDARLDLKYGKCKIGKLAKSFRSDYLGYSDMIIRDLASDFGEVNVEGHYSNVDIHIDEKASFRVDAYNLKYGSCRVKGNFQVTRRSYDAHSTGFDSNQAAGHKDDYLLDVNKGNGGRIRFGGANYSNLKVMPK